MQLLANIFMSHTPYLIELRRDGNTHNLVLIDDSHSQKNRLVVTYEGDRKGI